MIKQLATYYNQQMNNITNLEKNLTRCIERLEATIKTQEDNKVLSAMAYTGTLLDSYLQQEENHTKAKYYYDIFQREVNLYNKINIDEHSIHIEKRNRTGIMQQINKILQKHGHFKDQPELHDQMKNMIKEKDTEYFNQHIQKIRLCYEEHNIDQVWNQIQSLRQKAKTSIYIKQLIDSSNIQSQFVRYQEQYMDMKSFYRIFEQSQEDGWIYDQEQDNLKLEYKVYQEERTIAVRMSGQIQVEMLPFLAIVCQIDLTKDFIPFVEVSQQKKDNFKEKPARNLKIGFTLTSVPLLADRQCYYYAIGYDRIKTTGSIFILSKSFQDDKDFQQKFNYHVNHQDKIFLQVSYFCLEYKPVSKTKAKVRIASKANFQLTFLPLFILRLTARNFTFNYFKNIVKKAKTYKGSKWEEKVKSNPAMYNFFQSKIDEYFG